MNIQQKQSRMILSLNCARGESTTYAVHSFVTQNPKYDLLLLQEPWLNSNKEPPSMRGFQMFTPVPTNTKCVTYVRISACLQPSLALSESDCFLGLRITTPGSYKIAESPKVQTTIYNLYSPGRQRAICHFFMGFTPDSDAIICGDFNSHHRMWYGYRSGEHHRQLSNDAGLANQLVERITDLSLNLHNKPGLYTHFPRNNSSPSIVDLTFTRGQATLDLLDWTLGNDFGSDHLSTHLHVCNRVTTTVPRFAWSKANWGKFANEVSHSGLDFSNLGSTGEIERASENYTNILHKAIDTSIPKIRVNQQRKIRGWWNRELDQISENLRQL